MTRSCSALAAALTLTVTLALASPASAALDELFLISAPSAFGEPSSNGDSRDPSVSADGNLVAFTSSGDSSLFATSQRTPRRS